MAVKYLRPGADFGPADFPSDFGFTGSARVGRAAGGGMPARPAPHMAPPEKEPLVTMPMSQAIRTAHSLVQAGRQKGAQEAMGAPRPPMPGAPMQGPPMPPPRPAAPPGPPPGALSQMPGAPGMAEGGNFIAGAVKHPGREKNRAAASGRSVHGQMEHDKSSSDPSLRSAANLGLRLTGGDLAAKRKGK